MKKYLACATREHKRQCPISLRTRSKTRTHLGELIVNENFAATMFHYLQVQDVLALRETHPLWRDLPLNHIVERCLQPKMAFPLVGEFQLFHIFYGHNTDKTISKKEPYFKKAQNDYDTKRTSFETLLQAPTSITPQQEQTLIDLYHIMNSPDQQQDRLQIKVLSTIEDHPIRKLPIRTLNERLEHYINIHLKEQRIALFKHLDENPVTQQDKTLLTDTITKLIDNHPLLIFSTNKYGETPLHIATIKGLNTIARQLIKKRSKLNASVTKDFWKGYSPLQIAAKEGRAIIAQALIDAGAQINISLTNGSFNGYTPLHWAARCHHKVIVEMLINANADLTARNSLGYTPLHIAVSEDRLDIVNEFLKAKINFNQTISKGLLKGYSPLSIAIYYNYTDIEAALRHAGATK